MDRWDIKIFIDKDTIQMQDERKAMKILDAPVYPPDAEMVLAMVDYEGVGALMHRIRLRLPSTGTVTQKHGPAYVSLHVGKLSGKRMSNLDALINEYINIPWEGTICALVEEYIPLPPRTPRMQKRDIPNGVAEYVENFTSMPPVWYWHSDWKVAHGDDKSTTVVSDIKRKGGGKRPLKMWTRIGDNKYMLAVHRGGIKVMQFCIPKPFRVGVRPTDEEVLKEIRYQCYLGD